MPSRVEKIERAASGSAISLRRLRGRVWQPMLLPDRWQPIKAEHRRIMARWQFDRCLQRLNLSEQDDRTMAPLARKREPLVTSLWRAAQCTESASLFGNTMPSARELTFF